MGAKVQVSPQDGLEIRLLLNYIIENHRVHAIDEWFPKSTLNILEKNGYVFFMREPRRQNEIILMHS